VWWADLPLGYAWRPVVVLTRDDALSTMSRVTVAVVTSTIRGIDSGVVLDREDGVSRRCVVSLDNILTIERHLLDRIETTLGALRMSEVHAALAFALDLPRKP
jgi:mRNA interferase MazF